MERNHSFHLVVYFNILTISLTLLTAKSSASVLFANMTGDDLVGYPTPVPETYTGTAQFTFTDLVANRRSRIDFVFTQSGLDQILNVWLMRPVDPINGDLVIDFTQTVNLTILQKNGSFAGSYMSDQNYTKGIRQEPQMFYVNIKTAKFAAGAVRGGLVDLIPTPTTGLVPNAEVQVNFTGSEVVPTPGLEDGSGTASLAFYYLSNGSVLLQFDFVDVNVTDMTSVGLYSGEYGSSGELLWDMTPAIDLLAFDFNGFAGGNIIIDPGVAFRILNDVSIVNCQINSTSNPNGAIRGQLALIFVTLPPPPGTPSPRADVGYNTTPPAPNSSLGYTNRWRGLSFLDFTCAVSLLLFLFVMPLGGQKMNPINCIPPSP